MDAAIAKLRDEYEAKLAALVARLQALEGRQPLKLMQDGKRG